LLLPPTCLQSDSAQYQLRKAALDQERGSDGAEWLLGALLIFGAANNQSHFLPTRPFVKALEYENQTQAAAGNVTTIAVCIGCVFLIV
jgi:hypothetical protein